MITELPQPKELEGVTQQNFAEKVANHYEPVVFRGLAKDWAIVKAAEKSPKDVADYLKGFDNGKPLSLVVSPQKENGRMFYNENYDGFNFTTEKSTLSAALDRLLQHKEGSEDPNVFFQSVRVHHNFPGLEKELHNPLAPGLLPRIWVGSKIIVAPHFDAANNIAIVASGRRRFTLFPPEQINNLYVGRLDFTPAGQPISLVDLKNPDFERFPKFREALDNALSVELEAGDAIYIPVPWWHHVESLASFNVLVNYWGSTATTSSATPFPLLIHAIQALRHLPDAERLGWRSILDHYVFEQGGNPAEHLMDTNPGILGPMNPTLEKHVHAWLMHQLLPPQK